VPGTANHRPGKILGALALSLAAGGEQASDIDQLRAAPDLFGPVASDATVSRFMKRIQKQPEAFTYGFATMTRTCVPKLGSQQDHGILPTWLRQRTRCSSISTLR